MKGYIKQLLREGLLDDFEFDNHGKVIHTEFKVKDIELTLYRGLRNQFDNSKGHPELIPYQDGYKLIVSEFPDKLIWFTDNEEFAKKYDGYALITYKLPVKKHEKMVTYEDGYVSTGFIDSNDVVTSGYGNYEIKSDIYNNNTFYRGIELPEHWFWSYKAEKHIVCDSDLIISKDNIKINKHEKRF
jgi:hypothetical protein